MSSSPLRKRHWIDVDEEEDTDSDIEVLEEELGESAPPTKRRREEEICLDSDSEPGESGYGVVAPRRSLEHFLGRFPEVITQPIYPFPFPKFIAEKNTLEYSSYGMEERRQYLKRTAKIVRYQDIPMCRKLFVETRLRWRNDPLMSYSNYVVAFVLGDKLRPWVYRILGERLAHGQPKIGEKRKLIKMNNKALRPDWILEYIDCSYHPPRNRILITPNITLNKKDVIPVYTDIPTETLENLEIPNNLVYEYGDVNRINGLVEKDLKRALEEGEEDKNLIKCNCHNPDTPMQSCYDNPKCPCAKANKALQKLQSQKTKTSKFKTLDPIRCNTAHGPFYEFIGFACSSSCACKGHCDNNAMYLAENRHFPLEMYREDKNVGFSIRTQVAIPAGTPFLEFIGEIQEDQNLTYDSRSYAYTMTYPDDKAWVTFVRNYKKWTPSYKALLNKLYTRKYQCNPKYYGNAARTALHSCIANVEILRIFQKSFSPAHERLVMVALEDIYPGNPITLDYGVGYVSTQLKGHCKCRTFACHNGRHHKQFSVMHTRNISACLETLSSKRYIFYQQVIPQQSVKYVREVREKHRKLRIEEEKVADEIEEERRRRELGL